MENEVVVYEKNGKVSFWRRGMQLVEDKSLQVAATGTGAMMLMGSAHAEGIGIETFQPIISMITGLTAIVSGVGMAVLTVYATGKVFKWVKTAF